MRRKKLIAKLTLEIESPRIHPGDKALLEGFIEQLKSDSPTGEVKRWLDGRGYLGIYEKVT